MTKIELEARYLDFCLKNNIKTFEDIRNEEMAKEILTIIKPLKKELVKEYRNGNIDIIKRIKNFKEMIYYCNTAIKNKWFPE